MRSLNRLGDSFYTVIKMGYAQERRYFVEGSSGRSKLVKVYHRDGKEEWILLHVEIQGDTTLRDEFSAGKLSFRRKRFLLWLMFR